MKKKCRARFAKPALCSLALTVCLTVSGCGVSGQPFGLSTGLDDVTVYVIGQSKDSQFWDDVKQGALEASEEFNYNVIYKTAEQITDVETQRDLIQEAIQVKADAIVIGPNDPNALNEDLAAAVQAGIEVITIDADTTFNGRRSYIGTINASSGAIAARNAFTFFEDVFEDKALIVTEYDQTPSAQERISGFVPSLTGLVKTKAGAEYSAKMQAEGLKQQQANQNPNQAENPNQNPNEGPNNANSDDAHLNTPEAAIVAEAAQNAARAAAEQKAPPAAIAEAAGKAAAAAAIENGVAIGVAAQAAGQAAGMHGGDSPIAVQTAIAAIQKAVANNSTSSNVIEQEGGSPIDAVNPIATMLNCKGSSEVAKEQVLQLLSNDTDHRIKVIFTTGERSTIGACEAVAEADMIGKVAIIGYNTNETQLYYLKNGTLTGLIVQNPYNMGYLGVYYSGKILSGENVASIVDTGSAYVTRENLNSDEVRLLLDPAEFTKK